MTAVQKQRLIGFDALLKHRGVAFKLQPGGPTFTGIVQPVEPQGGEFQISDETRDESILTFKRSDLGVVIQIGDTFKEEPGTAYYRVTRLLARPSDVLVKYHCEAVIR